MIRKVELQNDFKHVNQTKVCPIKVFQVPCYKKRTEKIRDSASMFDHSLPIIRSSKERLHRKSSNSKATLLDLIVNYTNVNCMFITPTSFSAKPSLFPEFCEQFYRKVGLYLFRFRQHFLISMSGRVFYLMFILSSNLRRYL